MKMMMSFPLKLASWLDLHSIAKRERIFSSFSREEKERLALVCVCRMRNEEVISLSLSQAHPQLELVLPPFGSLMLIGPPA